MTKIDSPVGGGGRYDWRPTTPDGSTPTGGLFNYSGPVGGPNSGFGSAAHFEMVVNTLNALMPKMSAQNLQARLMFVNEKLQREETTNSIQSDKNEQQIEQASIDEQLKQLSDAEAKVKAARGDDGSSSLWDKIELAFDWIGAILSLVVGAVLCLIPGGQGIGAELIAGGVVGLLSAINSTVEAQTGHGILGSIVLAAHGTAAAADQADEAFGVILAVVGVCIAVVCLAGGAADVLNAITAVGNIALTAGRTALIGGEVGEVSAAIVAAQEAIGQLASSTTAIETMGQIVEKANSLAQSILQLVEIAGSIYSSALTYDATNMRAGAQNDRAQQEAIQAIVDRITDLVQALAEDADALSKSNSTQFTDFLNMMNTTATAVLSIKF